jgi:hypothetical protein
MICRLFCGSRVTALKPHSYLHPLRCTNSTNGTHVKTSNGNIYKQCDKVLGAPNAIDGFAVRSDCDEACNRNPDCIGYTATAPYSQNCSLLALRSSARRPPDLLPLALSPELQPGSSCIKEGAAPLAKVPQFGYNYGLPVRGRGPGKKRRHKQAARGPGPGMRRGCMRLLCQLPLWFHFYFVVSPLVLFLGFCRNSKDIFL